MLINGQRLIIAGPCAAESKEQIEQISADLHKLGVSAFRACLWKPRTKPGFDGVGIKKGGDWVDKVAKKGMIYATEVLLPNQAKQLIKNLVRKNPNQKFIFWIGARNQNHLIQTAIAKVLKKEKQVYLMIKNQVWQDEKHWIGIFEHIIAAGFPKERVLICHRGFMPNGHNPRGLRNLPHFEMSLKVKKTTGVPMILDPSHIGGEANKVIEIIEESLPFNFDGYMIEVHPNPTKALTDAAQQLTVEQLSKVISKIKKR